MADLARSPEATLDAYAGAVLAKDATALLGLYHQNVRVFDAWGVWLYDGAASWRATVDSWFGSLEAERVRVRFEDVRIEQSGSMAGVSAVVTYAGESEDGHPTREMQNRLTWLLEHSGDGWKIVHEHTSAPAGFADGKVILQREK